MRKATDFIFLSYARKDKAHIGWLEVNLAAAGYCVFIDREMEASIAWETTLREKIAGCKCVLVVWSNSSVDPSSWVHKEIEHAMRLHKMLIPVRISDVVIPEYCSHLNTVDLSRWQGNSQFSEWQKVLSAIQNSGCSRGKTLSALPARLQSGLLNASSVSENQLHDDNDVAFHSIKVESKEKYLDVVSNLKREKFVIAEMGDGVALLEKETRLNWLVLVLMTMMAILPGYIYYEIIKRQPKIKRIKVVLIEPLA